VSGPDRGARTRQFVRATGQFARTVFGELTRAGYGREDVLHFVNEMMALLCDDVRSDTSPDEQPGVFDAEAGILDRPTIQEVLEFELKRAARDRRKLPVALVGLDVVIPSWATSTVRVETHRVLTHEVYQRLRGSDAFGKLGPERYLVVLPESKEGVGPALRERLETLMQARHDDVPKGLALQFRFVRDERRTATAAALIEECFAQPAAVITSSARGKARAPRWAPEDAGRDNQVESIVLCLGGGAARAASHAGVLAVLEERGIKISGIAGSSGGALVGAMRARGMSPEEIVERFAAFTDTRVYRGMMRAYVTFLGQSRRGGRAIRHRALGESSLPFYSEDKLAAVPQTLLEEFVTYFVGPDCDFSTLAMPMAVSATDLVEGRAVALSHGSLHAALTASSAVPGLFPLQSRDQGLLADGSAVSEVPISAAHVLGISAPVLAVHLEHPRERVTGYRSSAEVVSRIGALIHRELVREQLRRARFLISVPVQEVGWLEFDRARESAGLGRSAAAKALAEGTLARVAEA
jgi:NTE family protein